jgi:hypothetical protein
VSHGQARGGVILSRHERGQAAKRRGEIRASTTDAARALQKKLAQQLKS